MQERCSLVCFFFFWGGGVFVVCFISGQVFFSAETGLFVRFSVVFCCCFCDLLPFLFFMGGGGGGGRDFLVFLL